MHPLIDLGVRQFLYIPLEQFSEEFHNELSLCRSIPDYRKKKPGISDYILVISQDCDINSKGFNYIELLVFRKAKARDSKNSSAIEYARNVHKIFIKDNFDYILKRDECSLISKDFFQKELERIKEKLGEITFERFENQNNESIMLSWLVNYYARRPLPDAFNRDLFDKYIKHPEGHPLQIFLLKYYLEIADIYAFVSPMDDENASSYDVTLTALLHQNCKPHMVDEISDELRKQIENIHCDENKLNMMQATGVALHDNALMDYVLMPNEFSRSDEINTRKLTLDFLCWMPKEEDIEP